MGMPWLLLFKNAAAISFIAHNMLSINNIYIKLLGG